MMVAVLLQFRETGTFRPETAFLEALEYLELEFDCVFKIEATGGTLNRPSFIFRDLLKGPENLLMRPEGLAR
jgi:hypothetical protein